MSCDIFNIKHKVTENREGFMSPSILQHQWAQAPHHSPTPLRKASSYVWRELQLQGDMHYKAGALEWLSWMSSSERGRETAGACNNRGNNAQLTTVCQPHSHLKGLCVSAPPRINVPASVCMCVCVCVFICVFVCEWMSSPKCTALTATRDLKSTDQYVLQECARVLHVIISVFFFMSVCVCVCDCASSTLECVWICLLHKLLAATASASTTSHRGESIDLQIKQHWP